MNRAKNAVAVALVCSAALAAEVFARDDDDALDLFTRGLHAITAHDLADLSHLARAAREVVLDEAAPRGARLRALALWLTDARVDDDLLAALHVRDLEVARAIAHARIAKAAARGDRARVLSFVDDGDPVVRGHVVDALARSSDEDMLHAIAASDPSRAVRARAARRLDARRPPGVSAR